MLERGLRMRGMSRERKGDKVQGTKARLDRGWACTATAGS